MQNVKVNYQTVIVNGQNAEYFLNNRVCGFYSPIDKCVVVFNYVLGPNLPPQLKGRVADAIDSINEKRPIMVAHEMHHAYNDVVLSDIAGFCGKNYYQYVALCHMNEISAYTAGELRGHPLISMLGVCDATVACAMLAGSANFMNVCDQYTKRFTDRVRINILQDLQNGKTTKQDLIELQKIYRANVSKLFTVGYYDVVEKYFTFDNICLMRSRNSMPQIQQAFNQFQGYVQRAGEKFIPATARMIDDIIAVYRER